MTRIPLDCKHVTAHRPYHDIGKWAKEHWYLFAIALYVGLVYHY